MLAAPAQAATSPRLTGAKATEIFVSYDKVADWLGRYPPKPATDATYSAGTW